MTDEPILNTSVHKSLARIAFTLSLLTSLSLPLGYFFLALGYESDRAQSQAEIGARLVAEFALADATWKAGTVEAVGRRLGNMMNGRLTVSAADQSVLLVAGPVQDWPRLERTASVSNDHGALGTVRLARSLQPVLARTALVALAGLAMGLALYFVFRRVPMRSLREAEQRILASQQALKEEIKAKERALKRAEHTGQAIRHLAYHDLLTDLPNRSLLQEQMQSAIEHMREVGRKLALITLDLDSFKEINDTLGHNKGDFIIREVGQRLRSCLKKTDLIARLGGDEFALMLPNIDRVDDVVEIANRVLETLDRPFSLDGYSFDITAGLGIVLFPDHGEDPKTLMQRADVAMYLAKDSNKSLAIYDSEFDPNSIGHLTMKGELRNAIEKGSMTVYYQPKIDLKKGLICGVEALVRWVHPERGFVGPDEFIPLAEQTGLIHPMTGLVFNITLNQLAQWRQSDMDIDVAINISVHSLHDVHLPERIMEMLTTWDIPPSMLTLEVTESAVMSEPQRALEVLTRLADMGVKLSIDDYGTGYSSLSYLKQLPVQEIKIDRSFVMEMVENENDNVIVRATIDMAHDLGLKVTAEGIENQETWDVLVNLGCDKAQGFYMSRPLPAEEFARWLEESQWGIRREAG